MLPAGATRVAVQLCLRLAPQAVHHGRGRQVPRGVDLLGDHNLEWRAGLRARCPAAVCVTEGDLPAIGMVDLGGPPKLVITRVRDSAVEVGAGKGTEKPKRRGTRLLLGVEALIPH